MWQFRQSVLRLKQRLISSQNKSIKFPAAKSNLSESLKLGCLEELGNPDVVYGWSLYDALLFICHFLWY